MLGRLQLRWNSVVHGHHVYEDIWTPFVGEILCVELVSRDQTLFSRRGVIACSISAPREKRSGMVTFLLWCNFTSCWATCASAMVNYKKCICA